MKLVYNVDQRPPLRKNLVFAFQQVLAIMAATLLVPVLVNGNSGTQIMSQPAALCGAGFGTLVYLLLTRGKSPVFLGSSFAFIAPLSNAVVFGRLGIFLGAVFAGAVYLVVALVIKFTGSGWVNKLLPPVVIGPTVALIGLSLCGSAVNNLANLNGDHLVFSLKAGFETVTAANVNEAVQATSVTGYSLVHIAVGAFAFFVTAWASIKGSKSLRMIPFIIGIVCAYAVALVLTFIGNATGTAALQLVNLNAFNNMQIFSVPDFTFFFNGGTAAAAADAAATATDTAASLRAVDGAGLLELFLLFAPVAFVTLAEHIADHKNLSSIIEHDLITDPGLHRTLAGDGLGSIVGSFFGGCPNTTYGECVGCVAISGDASVSTVFITAVYCILLSFFGPFTAFVNSIPACITGGVCIALYGFIAVSGLKMLQPVDLNDNRNLFVVAAILVCGIGGLTVKIGSVTISAIATGLILGILVNLLFNRRAKDQNANG